MKPSPGDEARSGEAIIRDLERLRAAPCSRCATAVSLHEILMSIALGFKNSLRCLTCLGKALEYEPARIRDSLWEFFQRKDCYLTAWNWANRQQGVPENAMPELLAAIPDATPPPASRHISGNQSSDINISTTWDAGDMGCGDLVLELRLRFQALRPGEVLQLRATDPGAPEDLPAWCRLTGHTLLRAEHPNYWIKRKE